MDLYVVLKRFGAILWPETAFIGPLSPLVSVSCNFALYHFHYLRLCGWSPSCGV